MVRARDPRPTIGDSNSAGPSSLVFVGDLRKVDGVKVVQLQQLKNLPRDRFKLHYLDLTCDQGNDGDEEAFPFLRELRAIAVPVTRLCTRVAMDADTFAGARRSLRSVTSFDALQPALADAFGPLYRFLSGPPGADVVVLSNSAGESDNYIFDIARIAGVHVRALDLGAKLIPNAGIDATAFIAPSHYVKQHPRVRSAAAKVSVVPNRVQTIPTYVVSPAVDFERFNRTNAVPTSTTDKHVCSGLRSTLQQRSGAQVVAYIGRLATEKSPGMFLRAGLHLRTVRRAIETAGTTQAGVDIDATGVEIIVVGDGPLMAPLQTASMRAGGGVHFLGPVSHETVVCILGLVDVLVVPSLNTETFGLIGAEAMAMGVPVVSFGIGGVGEYTYHRRTAFVANSTSPAALAQGINTVLRDAVLAETLRREGRRFIFEHFSVTSIIRRYTTLYSMLIAQSKRPERQDTDPPHKLGLAHKLVPASAPTSIRTAASELATTQTDVLNKSVPEAAPAPEAASILESKVDEPKVALNVALHAQVSSAASGRVVGSEITCAGFRRALHAQGHFVTTFYPFNYANLTEAVWDVVIIEGWFEMVHAFVHEVRRLSPGVRVYFICLDPAFPGLDLIGALDVDGFFTNSLRALDALRSVAPTEHMLLAADADVMRPLPGGADARYAHNVTFVGAAGFSSKANLSWMLSEAAPFGLAIYGTGWDTVPEFAPHWHGVLPKDDLARLYSSARFVLGVTMDAQREHGMINNRVFEALSCGATFVTEHFDALEQMFGGTMLYVRRRGDVARILGQRIAVDKIAAAGRELIVEKHTYRHRVAQILRFDELTRDRQRQRSSRESDSPLCQRSNCPRLAVMVPPLGPDVFAVEAVARQYGLQAALLRLSSAYNISMIDSASLAGRAARDSVHFFNAQFDFVLIVDVWGGDLELLTRSLALMRSWRPKIALLLWDLPQEDVRTLGADVLAYDVIFYRSERDRQVLEPHHPTLQHAFGVDIPSAVRMNGQIPAVNGTPYALCIAEDLSGDKQVRHLVKKARKGRTLLIAPRTALSESNLAKLLAYDIDVIFQIEPDTLVQLMRGATRGVLLLGCRPSTAEVVVLLALSLGVPVEMARVDISATQLQYLDAGWDADYFEQQLRLGVSRMLCYGSGRTAIEVTSPKPGDHVSGIVPIRASISHFAVRRDGAACLFIDGRMEMCLQQPHLCVALNFSSVRDTIEVTVSFGLMSNIYTDIVRNSSSVTFTVRPSKALGGDGGEAAHFSPREYVVHTPLMLRATDTMA
eukprot:g1060.t1